MCGGITLSYQGEIGPANYCHCEDCRRANGSAFNIGVRVERRNLQVNARSELRAYKYVSDSGKEIERYFCARCGSPIFTLHPAKPEYAWVKAGIIKDPSVVKPAFEIWAQDRVKWGTVSVTQSWERSRTT